VQSTIVPVKFLVAVSLCVALNLLSASYDALARGSGGSHSSGSHSSGQHSSQSHAHSKAAPGVQRDNHGRIKRSAAAKDQFKRQQPCPSTGKATGAASGPTTTPIGGGKFTKTTTVEPGDAPGQSRAEYVVIKNQEGDTIRTYKDSYDRAGNYVNPRKPLRGGPEGRPAN